MGSRTHIVSMSVINMPPPFNALNVVLLVLFLMIQPATANAIPWHNGVSQPLEKVSINIEGTQVSLELARTQSEQQRGLMFREFLSQNSGMLFVYKEPKELCFWMKNTNIPLSLAYLNESGVIVQIIDLIPHNLDSQCANEPIVAALEMNRDWFKKRFKKRFEKRFEKRHKKSEITIGSRPAELAALIKSLREQLDSSQNHTAPH